MDLRSAQSVDRRGSGHPTIHDVFSDLRGTDQSYFPYGSDMKLMKTPVITALLLAGFLLPAWAQGSEIQKDTQSFLEAYVRGDRQVILTFIDQENIMMYGSDATEIVHGSGALLKRVAADQQLWRGSAHFGAMEHVSLVQNHSFASIFFGIPFSVGGRPPVPVRVAAIWKREGKRWLLVQSSNAVGTEHQGAIELLRIRDMRRRARAASMLVLTAFV